jgi:hypothetical protein
MAKSPNHDVNFLHALVPYDPPVDIVARMMECRPEKLYELDHRRRTVLHAAAGSHSNKNAELIRLLVRVCPAASVVRDAEGKTPLHLACDGSYSFFVSRDDSSILEMTKPLSRDWRCPCRLY